MTQKNPLRYEELDRGGRQFNRYSNIFTYEDYNEIEMLYIFEKPDEALSRLSEEDTSYECSFTGGEIYPVVNSSFEDIKLKVFVPIEGSIEHDITEFPSHYLEDVRDDFYNQIVQKD